MEPRPAERVLIQLISAAFPLDRAAVQTWDVPADWASVVERAQFHHLAPLLFVSLNKLSLQNQVPAQVIEDLRLSHIRADVASWQAYRELGKLLDLFEREQIPVVLLKGCALGPTLYANMNLRQLGDLDLLFREDAKERVSALMIEQGYSPSLEMADGFGERFSSEQCFLRHGAHPAQTDVHWHIVNPPHYRARIPVEWFWQRTMEVNIGGRTAKIFTPEAQLLHLAAHWWLQHQGQGLRPSYDIALLLSRYRDQMDWQEVMDSARAFGLSQTLRATLTQVALDWGVSIARETFAQLRPTLRERVSFAMLTARRLNASSVWDAWYLSSLREQIVYLFQMVFPSPSYMRSRYRVDNAWLLPLYYGGRLARGAYLFALSVLSMISNLFRWVTRTQND